MSAATEIESAISPAHRAAQRRADKVTDRRDELARATLITLAELGYAHTSLRDVAANSEFSHGVLHYYFTDKIDLITHCVRIYKAECITRYDDLVSAARGATELRDRFAERLGRSLAEDLAMHRLWYDLRSQSVFEPALSEDVEAIDASLMRMICRVVQRYAELGGTQLLVDEVTAYATIDGLFQRALRLHGRGDADAIPTLVRQVTVLLPTMVSAPSR